MKKKFAIAVTVAVLALPLGASVTMAADGAALYATNCAGCHGPLETSVKKGATLARIQAGSGSMNISALSVADLTAISGALRGVAAPAATPAPTKAATPAASSAAAAATTPSTNTATTTGGQLPKTSTPLYDILLAGSALTLVGTIGFKSRKLFQ